MFSRDHRCEWRERAEQLERELEYLMDEAAFVDPATGVGNLNQLDLQFAKLLARWRRYGEPFSVALIGFEDATAEVPDLPPKAYAHLAQILMDTVRIEDSLCRASTHEFAVLLANSTIEGARAFIERARNNVARELVPTGEGSRFFRSVAGAAEWSEAVETLPGLLHLADMEMQKLHRDIALASRPYQATV